MTISEFTLKSSDLEPVRRFEVFSGSGRRREWLLEEKARIVAESNGTDETCCRTPIPFVSAATVHLASGRSPAGGREGGDVGIAVCASGGGGSDYGTDGEAAAKATQTENCPRRRRHRARNLQRRHARWPRSRRQNGRGGDPCVESGVVIGPTGAVNIMVATKPVDFRKVAEGLAALVSETMGADPFSGAVYVFRAKRTDRIKLICWDGTGVCLNAERLEDGEFCVRDGFGAWSSWRLCRRPG